MTSKREKMITLRINERSYDIIRDFAKNHGLSVNAYLNSIIDSQAEWFIPISSYNAVTVPKSMMSVLFSMSPEQASGEKQVDHRTDLWALGVVLYEMLAGRRPFAQDTIAALFHAVQALDPLPLIDIRPEVSPALQQLVTRLLQKQRDQRYPDAAALLEALDAVEPVRAG